MHANRLPDPFKERMLQSIEDRIRSGVDLVVRRPEKPGVGACQLKQQFPGCVQGGVTENQMSQRTKPGPARPGLFSLNLDHLNPTRITLWRFWCVGGDKNRLTGNRSSLNAR